MVRFRTALVLLDAEADPGRSVALIRAANLVPAEGGSITLAGLIEEPSWLVRALPGSDTMLAALEAQVRARLEAAAAPLRAEGRTVEVRTLVGRPRTAALAEAQRGNYDLVLRDGPAEIADGPSALDLDVLGGSPHAAVLVLQAISPGGPQRVLAAVDPTPPPDATETALNLDVREPAAGHDDAILAHAAALADRIGGELHVVHAQSVPGESLLRGQSKLSAGEVDDYLAAARAALQQALDALLARHPGLVPPERVHVAHGPADEAVLAVADELGAGVVVLGTAARTGLSRLVLGNTSETIARSFPGTVVTVARPT